MLYGIAPDTGAVHARSTPPTRGAASIYTAPRTGTAKAEARRKQRQGRRSGPEEQVFSRLTFENCDQKLSKALNQPFGAKKIEIPDDSARTHKIKEKVRVAPKRLGIV